MKKKEVDLIVKMVEVSNPYPSDVFIEPDPKEWESVGKFLLDNGYNPDRIFAKWGRMVWQNCIDNIKSGIEEIEE